MRDVNANNHSRLKSRNISAVLKLICTKQANTRSELARMTGLSKMTLSNIVTELIANDYVCEIDRSIPGASQGRNPIILEVSPRAPQVVGVFIGRVECSLVVSSIDAVLIEKTAFPIREGIDAQTLLATLYQHYTEITEKLSNRILGIGIASIGPIDKAHGIILNPPDFFGMRNIAIKAYFEEKTGLPVCFDNNMNAAVLAEKLFGFGKGLSSILYVGVMHGVGAGVISGGHLLEGPSGINGEIGHTSINFDGALCQCGNRGCLELYASVPRIVDSALREMKDAGVSVDEGAYDWKQLVENARRGEYYSMRALLRLCDYLAVGIVNMVNLFDCEEVFLGHDIALAEGLVEHTLEEAVNKSIFASDIKTVRVRISAFGTQAPLAGSVCLVLHQHFGG